MWVFSLAGFVSAVQDLRDAEQLVVRARIAADLDALREYVPDLSPTISNAGTDYPYRATCPKQSFAIGMARQVLAIGYGNFKNAVAAQRGWARERLYAQVWSVLYGAEDKLGISATSPPPKPVSRMKRSRSRPRRLKPAG